jgi:tRNA threonylcarbamoyladenosine biosynthesis protein TsaE
MPQFILALGPEEYFYSGDGLVLVEWADRVEGCLPVDRVEIQVELTGPDSRRFEIIPKGERYEAIFSAQEMFTTEPLRTPRTQWLTS